MGYENFSRAMRQHRETLGWSRKELGDELGVDTKTVYRWENGCIPRYKYIEAMANIFGVAPHELTEGTTGSWVDDVLSRLEYELSIVDANLEEDLPDSLRAYAIGKREALAVTIETIENERKAKA